MNRWARGVLMGAACCVLTLGAHAFAAEPYPSRTVSIFVGAAPGGTLDLTARYIADGLTKKWGQPVIVMNKVGASNTIAAEAVANAPADGYTLGVINGQFTFAPTQMKVSYDPGRSFTPITMIAENPNFLFVNPAALPVNSIEELAALARAKPGTIPFGSAGTASGNYLQMKILMNRLGLDMLNVPYQGGGPMTLALVRGDVALAMGTITTGGPYVDSGKLKVLAVSTRNRSSLLPNVPTIAEAANLPGFHESDWQGVVLPAGASKELLAKLHADIVSVLNDPELQKKMASQAMVTVGNSPAEFAEFIRLDLIKWADFAKNNVIER